MLDQNVIALAKAKLYQDKAVALSNMLTACTQWNNAEDVQKQINEIQDLFKQAEACINSCSAKIDIRQVDYLSAMQHGTFGPDGKKPRRADLDPIFDKKINECGFSTRLLNVLVVENICYIGDLVSIHREKDYFKNAQGMGKVSYEELKKFMKDNDLRFRMGEAFDWTAPD